MAYTQSSIIDIVYLPEYSSIKYWDILNLESLKELDSVLKCHTNDRPDRVAQLIEDWACYVLFYRESL